VIVLLLDELAEINFGVFKSMSHEELKNRSNKRSSDLENMFSRISQKYPIAIKTVRQSDISYKDNSVYQEYLNKLLDAYNNNYDFRSSVHDQVFENLTDRSDKHGKKFVSNNMPILKDYLLFEISLFEFLYYVNDRITEAYPGPLMRIRREIWYNGFSELRSLKRTPNDSYYTDVSCFVNGNHICIT